jgi:hypothetical protein
VLRELGEDKKADDLIEEFFSRKAPIDSYSGYPFKEMLQDKRFIERWKEITDQDKPDDRDIDTTIRSYYSENRSTIEDIKRLSQFTPDEFHGWFVNTDHPSVLGVADALSRIRYRVGGLEAETAKVEANVRTALRRFYDASKLNQVRLRSLFGNEPRAPEQPRSASPT